MITRIFRAQVKPDHQAAFEEKFLSFAVPLVEACDGVISVEVGKPTQWAPHEYVMISTWKDINSVKQMAGENWNEAHIPKEMAQYFEQYWIHQYESLDSK